MGAQALDRTDPLPLWAQLERDLQRRIDDGEFADGNFPTDLELTSTYEVSRHTVREAIRHLNRAGLLTRERGRGTVINTAEFEQPLGTLYSLFQSIEATGAVQDSTVLESEIVIDAQIAGRLDLEPETELFFLSRVRCADGAPLAVDRAWLPAAGIEGLVGADWSRTALYTELGRIGGPVPDQGWERLAPVVPDEADARLLELDAGAACFSLERLARAGDRPIEWRTTLIRGDRYRFVADWSRGSGIELRPTHAKSPTHAQ